MAETAGMADVAGGKTWIARWRRHLDERRAEQASEIEGDRCARPAEAGAPSAVARWQAASGRAAQLAGGARTPQPRGAPQNRGQRDAAGVGV